MLLTVPFLIFTLGLAAIWVGRRGVALGLWSSGVAALLVLFCTRATHSLNRMF